MSGVKLTMLTPEEQSRRLERLRALMSESKTDAVLIADNANLYYLTGRVFCGYMYIPLAGEPMYYVRRPSELCGSGVVYIRKPEEIPAHLGDSLPATIALEEDALDYSTICRLQRVFDSARCVNASPLLRAARAVKTPTELDKLRASAAKHEHIYRMVPHLYREGMTDLELQVEIERISRLEGCLGQFRIAGSSMELYMGNVLTGDNADTPSPYDFAMGGEGLDPSLPVGCNGSLIRNGQAVMVDMNGNFTGYMTDMTRTFYISEISDKARAAHQCSIDICAEMQRMAVPGAKAADLYHRALEMAREAGLEAEFMGHRQQAGFVGHGVGIEINELPVIAPRSRDILQAGNVIAVEPKFVIQHVGAVGIENTYCVKNEGPAECLTCAPEELVSLI